MAELVDALDSGSSDRKVVEVQVLFRAPASQGLAGDKHFNAQNIFNRIIFKAVF